MAAMPRGFARRGPAFARVAKRRYEQLPDVDEQMRSEREKLEQDWKRWVTTLFRQHVSDESGRISFAPHHDEFFEHVWSIERGKRPKAYVPIWPRGHAKSTDVELAAVALGARDRRSYVLYVCGTQEQADDHAANIADMLTEPLFAAYYPEHADRRINKFGSSEGWRRNRIRTAGGLTVDAIGLDTARARGKKLENLRPDVIIFDDLDDEADTLKTVLKKIRAITKRLLPAGAIDLAVIACQNLVHEDSIFAQLADGRADFLKNRVVSGPIPAIEGFEYEEDESGKITITEGEPTWDAMGIPECERIIEDEGLEAFLSERQHEVDRPAGTLVYRRSRVDAALKRGDEVEPREPGEATQILAIDPGYSKRAAALAIQEVSSDRVEMWKEWSFTECEEDHIAKVLAEHVVTWRVRWVYYDSEQPSLGKAIKKHVRRIAQERKKTVRVGFQAVAFGKYKRVAIHTTRWMLQKPNEVAWKADTTEEHTPSRRNPDDFDVREVPSIFRTEIRKYELEPGKNDEAVKEDDHGPDAWHAYAVRHLRRYLKAQKTNKKKPEKPPHEGKDWIPSDELTTV